MLSKKIFLFTLLIFVPFFCFGIDVPEGADWYPDTVLGDHGEERAFIRQTINQTEQPRVLKKFKEQNIFPKVVNLKKPWFEMTVADNYLMEIIDEDVGINSPITYEYTHYIKWLGIAVRNEKRIGVWNLNYRYISCEEIEVYLKDKCIGEGEYVKGGKVILKFWSKDSFQPGKNKLVIKVRPKIQWTTYPYNSHGVKYDYTVIDKFVFILGEFEIDYQPLPEDEMIIPPNGYKWWDYNYLQKWDKSLKFKVVNGLNTDCFNVTFRDNNEIIYLSRQYYYENENGGHQAYLKVDLPSNLPTGWDKVYALRINMDTADPQNNSPFDFSLSKEVNIIVDSKPIEIFSTVSYLPPLPENISSFPIEDLLGYYLLEAVISCPSFYVKFNADGKEIIFNEEYISKQIITEGRYQIQMRLASHPEIKKTLDEGKSIYYQFFNKADIRSSSSYLLKRDNLKPEVEIEEIPTYFKPTTPVIIKGSLKDVDSGIKKVVYNHRYLAPGSDLWEIISENCFASICLDSINKFGNFGINKKVWEEGIHNLEIYAFDKVGNYVEKVLNFTVDGTSPEFTIDNEKLVFPNGKIYLSGEGEYDSTIYISGDGIDSNQVQVKYFKENSTGNLNGIWQWVIPDEFELEQGRHNFYLYSIDKAGNRTKNKSLEIIVDKLPLVLGIKREEIPAVINYQSLIIKGSVGSQISNLKSVKYFLDEDEEGVEILEKNGIKNTNLFFYLSNLSEGEHYLTLRAENEAGNYLWLKNPVFFSVDLTPPQIPFLEGMPYLNGNLVSLSGKGEPGTKVEIYEKDTFLASFLVYQDGKWNGTISELSVNDHFLTLKAKDNAGNTSTNPEFVKISVVSMQPDYPIITHPQPNQVISDTYYPLFEGYCEPEAIVELCTDKKGVFARIQADKEGKFSYTPEEPFENGFHYLTARIYINDSLSDYCPEIMWKIDVPPSISKENLTLETPLRVYENTNFSVYVFDKDKEKTMGMVKIEFLGKQYFTDLEGKVVINVPSFKELEEKSELKEKFSSSTGQFKISIFAEKTENYKIYSAQKEIIICQNLVNKLATFNQDGINDFVSFSSVEYPVKIYNRQGILLKNLENGDWYGIDERGDKVGTGVYIYQTADGKTGTILIKR